MEVIDVALKLKFTDSFSYRFNSKIAVILEKEHKWREAMTQWTYAMNQANMPENQMWAYQRARYCRKQFIKSDMGAGMSAQSLPEICLQADKKC